MKNIVAYLLMVIFAFAVGNQSNTKKSEIIIVSKAGDPVSGNSAGPFQPATTAYLAGWESPRVDGGLSSYAQISGATWIWLGNFIGEPSQPLYFPKLFSIPVGAFDITGTLEITADNFFSFSVNGSVPEGTGPPDHRQWANVYRFSINNLKPGDNYLFVTAQEAHPKTPSGLVYKLTIFYSEIPLVKKGDSKNYCNGIASRFPDGHKK